MPGCVKIRLIYTILRFTGVVSIFIGGWWAAAQRHLGRILGYVVITEIGYSLLAVGTTGGMPLHFALLMPRALGYGVFSLALSAIRARTGGLDFHQVQGVARRLPIAAAGVVLAQFTLAGLPLLAGFPVHLALWETVGKQYLWAAMWSLFGSTGLMAAGLRSLSVLLASPEDTSWKVGETRLGSHLTDRRYHCIIGGWAFLTPLFPCTYQVSPGVGIPGSVIRHRPPRGKLGHRMVNPRRGPEVSGNHLML